MKWITLLLLICTSCLFIECRYMSYGNPTIQEAKQAAKGELQDLYLARIKKAHELKDTIAWNKAHRKDTDAGFWQRVKDNAPADIGWAWWGLMTLVLVGGGAGYKYGKKFLK